MPFDWLLLVCIYSTACTTIMVSEPQCRAVLAVQEAAICVSPKGDIYQSPKKNAQ